MEVVNDCSKVEEKLRKWNAFLWEVGLPSVATLVHQRAKGIHVQGEYFWNVTTFNLIP